MDQDKTWHGDRPRPRRHCFRWDPSPKRGTAAPTFRPMYCGQTAGWIKMPLGTEVDLGPDHIELDGDPASSPPKKGTVPQFSAHICCGQTAGWIKMPLGTEEDLDQSQTVLDLIRTQFLSKKEAQPPILGQWLLWPNGWIDQDCTWYEGKRRPRRHCVRWGPSSP